MKKYFRDQMEVYKNTSILKTKKGLFQNDIGAFRGRSANLLARLSLRGPPGSLFPQESRRFQDHHLKFHVVRCKKSSFHYHVIAKLTLNEVILSSHFSAALIKYNMGPAKATIELGSIAIAHNFLIQRNPDKIHCFISSRFLV